MKATLIGLYEGDTICSKFNFIIKCKYIFCFSKLLMSQLVGRIPGFIFVPPHPVFFGTSLVLPPTSPSAAKNQEKPRDQVPHTPKLPSLSLLLMEQLVASYGLFSSHHFQPFYFAGFFSSLPHPTGLVSHHPLTQQKKSKRIITFHAGASYLYS